MGYFKQLCLPWIFLSVAACVSCQELTSTLREGNRTCRGEEVIFTCTSRSATLPVIAVAWSSLEYIGAAGGSLQLSTANMLGTVETVMIDGNITATAILTNNTNVNGVLVLESTLRITADVDSTVTCSHTSGDTESIEFSVSAFPGVPRRISAEEISRFRDTCIILVTWDRPANSDASDIDRYIVYVTSRNIRDISSSTISSLPVINCDDDDFVQVAAVNRVGCVGMNSSEVQPVLLVIPTIPIDDGSTTTGDPTCIFSQLDVGTIAGIAVGCFVLAVVVIVTVTVIVGHLILKSPRKTAGESDKLRSLPKKEEVEYVWELQQKASIQAKKYYQQQSKHVFDDLGNEEDRVAVPIWIDKKLDRSWKASLHEAVQAINEAAPGLTLSITEDSKQAIIHVCHAIDKKEIHTTGNIKMRSTSGQTDHITTIHLGKWRDDAKKGISIRELFHALRFLQDNNNYYCFGLDPRSITLYQDEEAYDAARRKNPGDLVWWLKVPITKLSELDKVYLNLVYCPCRDTTATNSRYAPKLGKTGMYYCGRSVMVDHTYPGDKYVDGVCGPDYGPNCPACRTIKNNKVEEIVAKEKWQGMTGRVYCGKLFAEPAARHNGVCGMNNGPACPDCNDLLNKEPAAVGPVYPDPDRIQHGHVPEGGLYTVAEERRKHHYGNVSSKQDNKSNKDSGYQLPGVAIPMEPLPGGASDK